MPRYLYVFVDESGTPSSGECYVVAGAWCVSDRTNPDRTLQPTVDALTVMAESLLDSPTAPSELKGSRLPTDVLLPVVESLGEGPAYDDPSVTHQQLPWAGSRPLRFTVHALRPDLGIELLAETGDGSSVEERSTHPETLQSLALVTILDPLLHPGTVEPTRIDQVRVVLDAEVWQGPVERVEAGLEVVENSPAVPVFETRDSKRTPGLQIADLAAYTWGRHRRTGDCGRGVARLAELLLADE